MLSRFAVENSHVTSPPGIFPKHQPFQGMLRPAFISQRQTEEPPNIRDTSGISGNVLAHPQASSSAPYPQELNSTWQKNYRRTNSHVYSRENWKTRTRPRSEMPVRTVSQTFSHPQWRRLFKELWGRPTTTADYSDLHFDKFPTPATFACWKIRFKTEVCTCSQFPTEAMQWIKEVELVDSVDDLRSSSSIRGISMPNFEVLDARICFSPEQNHP